MNKKLIYGAIAALSLSLGFTSCDDDDLDPNSIFNGADEELDPESITYKFDKWLMQNYLEEYNLEFRYKMQHIGTDMAYNLVPATLTNAQDLALLNKYLWFDVYADLVGKDFLRQYGPKIIHVIGSPAYNPANHTEILGLAEGGLKVSLFKVNEMDITNPDLLNEHYFKTMHHEFSHILHQTKTYPKEFDLINASDYEPQQWQDRNGAIVNSLGCTTTYASSQAREDFAETCANYITRTYDQWDLMMWMAAKGWYSPDDDEHSYGYYYYTSPADLESDTRTYWGEYISPESNGGIYGMGDVAGSMSETGSLNRSQGKAGSGFNITDCEAIVAAKRTALATDLQNAQRRNPNVDYTGCFTLTPMPDTDNKDGRANIEQKVTIVRNWFKDAWGLDIDALRDEVQKRQANIDIQALRAQIEAVQ